MDDILANPEYAKLNPTHSYVTHEYNDIKEMRTHLWADGTWTQSEQTWYNKLGIDDSGYHRNEYSSGGFKDWYNYVRFLDNAAGSIWNFGVDLYRDIRYGTWEATKDVVTSQYNYAINTDFLQQVEDTKNAFGRSFSDIRFYEGVSGAIMTGNIGRITKQIIPNASTTATVTAKTGSAYEGVQAASKYLQEQGVPRVYRKQILESFEVGTISLRTADNVTFGLRFYGGAANQSGRYLFPTFTNYTNRAGLALPPSWNSMSRISQFQLAPGSTYIFGRAASQGGIYSGGSYQMYINNLNNLIK